MGRADGLLVGGSLLTGVLLGPRAILLAPTVYVLVQLLGGRVAVLRIVLCCLLAGIGSLRTPDGPAVFAFDTAVLSSTSAIGQVRSMPESVDGGQRFLLDVDAVLVADEWRPTRFTALLTLRGGDLNVGDKLWVAWSLVPPENLPPDYLAYVHSQGADTTAAAFTGNVRERGESWRRPFVELRQTLSDTLRTAAPDDSGALLAGLVTGDDSGLGERASVAFLDTGTTHITAVSGSNLALVAGVWSALGSASGWRRRWWLGAAIVASVWVYAAVVGFQPPAMRAAVVVSLTAFAIRVGRRADPLTLVLLAAGTMAMVDPHRSQSLSFQLSVLTSAALVSCLPRRPDAGPWAWLNGVATGVVCAQFAALPLLVATFGTWSPLSIPANLAIVPLVTPTFALAFFAALIGLVWPAVGVVLAGVAGVWAGWIIRIVESLADLAQPASIGTAGRMSVWLIGVLSVLVVGALSRDVRRWFDDVRAAHRTADLLSPLTIASLCGGAAIAVVVLRML